MFLTTVCFLGVLYAVFYVCFYICVLVHAWKKLRQRMILRMLCSAVKNQLSWNILSWRFASEVWSEHLRWNKWSLSQTYFYWVLSFISHFNEGHINPSSVLLALQISFSFSPWVKTDVNLSCVCLSRFSASPWSGSQQCFHCRLHAC